MQTLTRNRKIDSERNREITERNRQLAMRVSTGDREAREQMILLNLDLVHSIAHWYADNTSIPYEDLSQEGNIGLIRAVERYSADRGVSFGSFATIWISNRIKRSIHTQGRNVRVSIKESPKHTFATSEINGDIHIDKPDHTEEDLERYRRVREVVDALKEIDQRYARVIRAFYGIDCDKMNLSAIADELGVSLMTCRSYKDRGIEAIKRHLGRR